MKTERIVLLGCMFACLFFFTETQLGAATGTCYITDSPSVWPAVSAVSQNEEGKENTYWIHYSGPFTKSLKISVKHPSNSSVEKQIKKLDYATPVSGATIPYSFAAEPGNADEGPALLKIKHDTGTCSYPFYLADHAFESHETWQIPDDGVNYAEALIWVKNVNTIQKLRVSLWMTHPSISDLYVQLVSPDNTTVILFYGSPSGADFGTYQYYPQRTVFDDAAPTLIFLGTPPFVGSYAPPQPFSVFNGMSGTQVNGIWKLQIFDGVAGNTPSTYLHNFAVMIDDYDRTRLTWTSRLTKEALADAGVVTTPEMETKLVNTFYSMDTIINGQTDRLVDSFSCTSCHSGQANQGPSRYLPVYPVTPFNSHYQDKTFTSTYSWWRPNLIHRFLTSSAINKPEPLKLLFLKWLEDGTWF